MASEDDARDIHAVQQTLLGETEAFNEIVERYTKVIYNLALRMLGDREAADEATQEIFLKLYRSLGSFKLGRRFFPWMYTVALNYLRSRRQSRDRREPEPLSYEDALGAGPHYDSPDEQALNREAERLAQHALNGLKPKLREVFVLRELDGLSVEETANVLGIPTGSVKTYLHRARKTLIAKLSEQGIHGRG